MKQYTLKKLLPTGEYWFHNPPLKPMTHKKALIMRSKLINPNAWALHELIPVVVKFFPVLNHYGICHAESHQNAFRASFDTEQDAIDHAINHGCTVITYVLPAFVRNQAI